MHKRLYGWGFAVLVAIMLLTSACGLVGSAPPVVESTASTVGKFIAAQATTTAVPTVTALPNYQATVDKVKSDATQSAVKGAATTGALWTQVAHAQATGTALAAVTSTLVPASATPEPAPEVIGNSPEELVTSPYMLNYGKTLSYSVPVSLQVPANFLEGFYPVASLIMTNTVYPNGYTVTVPDPPASVDAYSCFPQDYSVSDAFNRGCGKLQAEGKLPWKTAIAGYREGDNWSCVSTTGWCADATDAFNWDMWNGLTVCHPAVGCLQNPNPKGAVSLLIVNFHDSDEAWDVRNGSGVYVVAGWAGFGQMWDLSGKTYDVGEGIAALRNHYLYNLAHNEAYWGQCGDSKLCESVLYVVVARIWDRPELGIGYSHYELLSAGIWTR